ncbi:hypothetical protein [Corynebacterium matruchotii]|uniref:hypothetical protein n=1 Tax=Corynebacterium matruchotii TaxID=43768 RepID=UPI00288C33CD|nr:hypothetical protein [Corynebacterium matruchotii]
MRRIKLTIVATCAAVAAATITPAHAAEEQHRGSVETSVDVLSAAAEPIYGPAIRYLLCASGSSHGLPSVPPGYCLREALSY